MSATRLETTLHYGARSGVLSARPAAGAGGPSAGFERLMAESRLRVGLGDEAPEAAQGGVPVWIESQQLAAAAAGEDARASLQGAGSARPPELAGRMPAGPMADASSPGRDAVSRVLDARFEVLHPALGRLDVVAGATDSGRESVAVLLDASARPHVDARRASIERALAGVAGRPVDLTVGVRGR